MMLLCDLVQRMENSEATFSVEILGYVTSARPPGGVTFGPIFAGKKASRQRKIVNDAESFSLTQIFEVTLETGAFDQAIVRLQGLISRQASLLADLESRCEPVGFEIGSPNESDLPLLDELCVSPQGLLLRRIRIIGVRLVEIDVVSLQALQGVLSGAQDVGSGEPFGPIPHLHADFCSNDDVFSISISLDPVAENRLRFSAHMAGHPFGIDIGGVNRTETGRRKGIQQLTRCCRV